MRGNVHDLRWRGSLAAGGGRLALRSASRYSELIMTPSKSVPAKRPSKIERRKVWVVVSPAERVPGEWLAHCLDLNIMSQGRSLSHALDMMIEAVELVVDEDCKAGLDPFDRSAPAEDWAEWSEHMRDAELSSLEELEGQSDDGDLAWIATQLTVRIAVAQERGRSVLKVPQAMAQHASVAA
jgi:predicted RNase H-like HicB family nuclease